MQVTVVKYQNLRFMKLKYLNKNIYEQKLNKRITNNYTIIITEIFNSIIINQLSCSYEKNFMFICISILQ